MFKFKIFEDITIYEDPPLEPYTIVKNFNSVSEFLREDTYFCLRVKDSGVNSENTFVVCVPTDNGMYARIVNGKIEGKVVEQIKNSTSKRIFVKSFNKYPLKKDWLRLMEHVTDFNTEFKLSLKFKHRTRTQYSPGKENEPHPI